MATISENLQIIADSTAAIKQAIIDKGGDATGDITTWANAISGLSGGSESGGAGSVFKITNKLNGQLFGGLTYTNTGEIIHQYSFSGGTPESLMLIPVNPNVVIKTQFLGYHSAELFYTDTYNFEHLINSKTVALHSGSYAASGCFSVAIDTNGTLLFYAYGNYNQIVYDPAPLEVAVVVFAENKNYDIDFFKVQGGGPCFVKDTKIIMSDNSYKVVQDINYNDELLVWNFDEGKYDIAKPLWIKKKQISTYYYKVTLENGNIINLMGSDGKCHRLYSVEDGMFISATDMIGKNTYTKDGEVKVISCELINEQVEYYNIITEYHMNLFANDILTSCRYNNLYPIQDMKFIKDDRLNRAPKWKLYEQFRYHLVLGRYIEGLRLYEQMDIPLEDTIRYCERLESLRKTLDEFDENKTIFREIEDTEVGWIDRDGNSYGFKLYMPGQNNHIILADKICKELNIETENTSRYLEKEGWLKYTTDFVLNSNDKEVNDKQLDTLKRFLNTPNKLKVDGKIRIGNYRSPHVNVSEFNNMDKYSFEYRKQRNLRK